MLVDELNQFLNAALHAPEKRWDHTGIGHLAFLRVPDAVLGNRGALLRADVNTLWAQWFLESMCDPEPHVEANRGFAFIMHDVASRVRDLLRGVPDRESKRMIEVVARLVDREVERRREARRLGASLNFRHTLIDLSGSQPRCWMCGYPFEGWAIDRFLGQNAVAPSFPHFVDIVKPRLVRRDLEIEVDHVVPVAAGGREGDNLRLSCGWCNKSKSANSSLYDVMSSADAFIHPKLGLLSIPRPFWVVRFLAIHGECEWPGDGGCSKSVKDAELTICPWHKPGAMNPANMRVTCGDHHALGEAYLVQRQKMQSAGTATR
jgi:hypothetical protein